MAKKGKKAKKAKALTAQPKAIPRPRASYEAGMGGRRLSRWYPGDRGPNDAILHDLITLRNRSRDSVRNNAWIKRGVNTWVSNEIGCGIIPHSQATDETFRKAADALWKDWVKVADADGQQNFYGMLSMAVRNRIDAGECFLRIRLRPRDFGLPVPFQLQGLEPEFCPIEENRTINNGRIVRAGVEFDAIGKRTAYYMYRSHPSDPFLGNITSTLVPVPADMVIHHYTPLRFGQIRGVPWTVQALIKAKDFDEYDDAELVRKKGRSEYTGFIKQSNFPDEAQWNFNPMTGEAVDRDSNNLPIFDIEPGSFVFGLPGEEPVFFDGDNTGSGYADFVRQQLMGVAASLDIPYELLSGDMKGVNDRLMRVLLNEFHRILEQTQWLITIPQICRPVWEWFIDLAVLTGKLYAPDYAMNREDYLAVMWSPHRWPYIHPLQDVQAKKLEIESGLNSQTGAAAEMGELAEEIDEQNAADRKRHEELGLKYATDEATGTVMDPTAGNEEGNTGAVSTVW